MEIQYDTLDSDYDYDSLHIFHYFAYYHVLENKLKLKANKAIFLGFVDGIQGYHL